MSEQEVLDRVLDALNASGLGVAPKPIDPQYCPHPPNLKQSIFLSPATTWVPEVLYGGAAGGGKSDALLMAALQYVDVPGYAALLLRRTFSDLALPEALMDRAHTWLDGSDAHWDGQLHTWRFPSGATLTFGYLQHPGDEQQYKSTAFQMVGFDELTDFWEPAYEFLFSRLRRLRGLEVPIRMRGATNPTGRGREWVDQRFVRHGREHGRVFIPARLEDNPALDQEEYDRALRKLGPVLYRQLRWGDWDVKPEGNLFKRVWFPIVNPSTVPDDAARVRRWDLAATETPKGGEARRMGDPDWTAGLRLARSIQGMYYVEDVVRFRESPGAARDLIRATAERDGREVKIRMEQEGGASGKYVIADFRRHVLDGYDFRGVPSTGSKETRANPVAARAQEGEVLLVDGPWVEAFLDEVTAFPEGVHDDQVDALSGAYGDLAGKLTRQARAVKPTGFTAGSHWLNQ